MVAGSLTGSPMGIESILVWNVHRLNTNGRHDVVRGLVALKRPSIVCLQETKRDVFSDLDIMQLLGRGFDYSYLLVIHARGGILLAWRSSYCSMSSISSRSYLLSTRMCHVTDDIVVDDSGLWSSQRS
jgi:hypothetical protein